VPQLVEHSKGRYHVWSAGSTGFSPLSVEKPEVPDTADQVWLREHALAPWRYDVVLNPDPRRALGVRLDPSLDFDLDEITWIADDGIRYLNPEMALCYKARLDRRKDRQDLLAVFVRALQDHEAWAPDLPRNAVIYSSECPRVDPLRARGVNTHVMAQVPCPSAGLAAPRRPVPHRVDDRHRPTPGEHVNWATTRWCSTMTEALHPVLEPQDAARGPRADQRRPTRPRPRPSAAHHTMVPRTHSRLPGHAALTKKTADLSLTTVHLAYGPNGNAAEAVYDMDFGMGFSGSVTPGKAKTARFGFTVPKNQTIDVEVEPGFLDYESCHFEGVVK
jgi:hypothetical protein